MDSLLNKDAEESTPKFYGGWIKFFRIFNLLYWVAGVVITIAVIGIALFFDIEPEQNLIDLAAITIEMLPGTIMSFIIWKSILVCDCETPNKIRSLLDIEFTLNVLTFIALFFAFKEGYVSDKPNPIFFSLIYYFIWTSYLKRSKRVLSLYGSNTFKK